MTLHNLPNSIHKRTHATKKNSGETVRRLGTITQSIFCAQSGAGIRLDFREQFRESRYPGALLSVLENFRPPLLLTRLTVPGSPRMGVLNQQILIHRYLLYEESMECGPPCHISGCIKEGPILLPRSCVFISVKVKLINIDVSYQLSSRHF